VGEGAETRTPSAAVRQRQPRGAVRCSRCAAQHLLWVRQGLALGTGAEEGAAADWCLLGGAAVLTSSGSGSAFSAGRVLPAACDCIFCSAAASFRSSSRFWRQAGKQAGKLRARCQPGARVRGAGQSARSGTVCYPTDTHPSLVSARWRRQAWQPRARPARRKRATRRLIRGHRAGRSGRARAWRGVGQEHGELHHGHGPNEGGNSGNSRAWLGRSTPHRQMSKLRSLPQLPSVSAAGRQAASAAQQAAKGGDRRHGGGGEKPRRAHGGLPHGRGSTRAH